MILKSVELTVKGLVQGVGFRYYVRDEAKQLGISGWVKNLSNGDVLILAQGEESGIDEFIEKIKSGNSFARIEEVEVKEAGEEMLNDFQIKY
ncbi:MAG: acylphosphatase [bacterium]|nr:acylphosphatase [bacterium]